MRPSPGDVIAQHYRLISVLGEGGTSLVFSAENIITGKSVAIKWLLPELLPERDVSLHLLRDAQKSTAIEHPNVVHVFDVGRHAGSLFLVMELLYGKPLSASLTDSPLEPHAFVRLMLPVLRGVQAAHDAGVAHRNLKPDNIFLCVDTQGQARYTKLLSLGVSRLLSPASTPAPGSTSSGPPDALPVLGTPEPPHGEGAHAWREDLLALGSIFYRALSGVYPYRGQTHAKLTVGSLETPVVPLHQRCPKLDRGLGEVVMRALVTDPARQFASVTELASALVPYLHAPKVAPAALVDLPVREQPSDDARVTVRERRIATRRAEERAVDESDSGERWVEARAPRDSSIEVRSPESHDVGGRSARESGLGERRVDGRRAPRPRTVAAVGGVLPQGHTPHVPLAHSASQLALSDLAHRAPHSEESRVFEVRPESGRARPPAPPKARRAAQLPRAEHKPDLTLHREVEARDAADERHSSVPSQARPSLSELPPAPVLEPTAEGGFLRLARRALLPVLALAVVLWIAWLVMRPTGP